MIQQDIIREAYRRMLTIRTAENMIADDFRNRKIFSFYHSSAGQEAAAVGVCLPLETEDRVYGNHRSHGHYIAKGGNLFRMFAEIYGSLEGCCKGYGGSMHMLDKSCGFMGTTPILGSIVPIAAGSAFQQKTVEGNRNITVCFFGDGASEEGVVYETLNYAAVLKLPVLFVIEDNLFAVNTPEKVRRSPLFSRRLLCESLGVRYLESDGSDFENVYTQASMLVRRLRNGHGPALLRVLAFREMAHSGPIMDESVRTLDVKSFRDSEDSMRKLEKLITAHIQADIAHTVYAQVSEAFNRAREGEYVG